MDGQQHPGGPEQAGSPESGVTSPAAATPGGQARRGRAGIVRRAVLGRTAGWIVAAALAGAVVTLSVVMATASPATLVLRPAAAPAGGPCRAVPGAPALPGSPPAKSRVGPVPECLAGLPAGQAVRVPPGHIVLPCRVPADVHISGPAVWTSP